MRRVRCPDLSVVVFLGLSSAADCGATVTGVLVENNAGGGFEYREMVRADGVLLDAVNLGHSGADETVNGVVFQSAPGADPSGARWSVVGPNNDDGLNNAGIDDVFFSEIWGGAANVLSYDGLEAGKRYLVQVLHGEPRNCCSTIFANHRLATDVDVELVLPPIELGNGINGENPPGANDVAVVSFQLEGVTEFTYTANGGPGRGPSIAGFQVREVSDGNPGGGGPEGDAVMITEFVAAGNDSLADEDGSTPDWIEIYNPTDAAVDLEGYWLTDDAGVLAKWVFPDVVLGASGYLVVFASDKDRRVAGGELHTNFRLASAGEYLALVAPDGETVLAEFAPVYPVQEAGFSYGVTNAGEAAYFSGGTPGRENGAGIGAPLLAPAFSSKREAFVDPVRVELSTGFPGGEIRYTTDGSVPTAASALYGGALEISETTAVRARVFDPVSGEGGEVDSGAYTRLGTAPRGAIAAPSEFDTNLPVVILENYRGGAIPGPGARFRFIQVNVFEPDPATGRVTLNRKPDATYRAGIRGRGQSSSGFAKKQYRLEIWNEGNEERNVSLLGMPSESDWVLGAPYADESLIRNSVMFEFGRDIGFAAPRTRYCEVFLNTRGGAVDASDYHGLCYIAESIKIDKNRVDVTPLDEVEGEDGGYIIRHESNVANQTRISGGWRYLEIKEPNRVSVAERAFISDFVNGLDQVLRTPQWNDPVDGFRKYIDVASWTDALVINEFTREQDNYVRSAYLHKDRGGKLKNGPMWDYNLSFGMSCCFNSHLTGVDPSTRSGWQWNHAYNRGARENGVSDGSHGATMRRHDWYRLVLRDEDFMQGFIDRYQELRETVLSVESFHGRVDRHAELISDGGADNNAVRRNFTIWRTLGSQTTGFQGAGIPAELKRRGETWEGHVQLIKDWSLRRLAWMDSQFLPRPVLGTRRGVVPAGGRVTVEGEKAVYYTMDGSDPRAPGGTVGATAVMLPAGAGQSIPVDGTMRVVARVHDAATGDWSGPVEGLYVVGEVADAGNLIISELNYHPAGPTPDESAADPTLNDDDFEFVELRNVSAAEIDLSGVRFVDGIDFEFPLGTVLGAGEFVLLVESRAAFERRYGAFLPVAGEYANKLSNDGERVSLVGVSGEAIAVFEFNDIWYRATDGGGKSLSLVDDAAAGANYGSLASWGKSEVDGGTPGAVNDVAPGLRYGDWLAGFFDAVQMADPAVTGVAADFDSDGLVALVEYGLGLNPSVGSGEGRPRALLVEVAGSAYAALEFRRQKGATDVGYRVEVSANLLGWELVDVEVGAPVDNGDGTETVTVRDEAKVADGERRYLRLVVELR